MTRSRPLPARSDAALALRILLVTTIPPFPVVSGRSLVLAHLVEAARSAAGAACFRIALLGHDRLPPGLDPEEARAIAAASVFGSAGAMVSGLVRLRPPALQQARLLDARVLACVEAEAEAIGANVIIGDALRLEGLLALRRPGRRVLLNADDLLSLRYRRLADWILAHRAAVPNAFGFHAHLLPGPVLRALGSPGLQARFFRFEAALLRRAEDRFAKHGDGLLMLNSGEAAMLRARVPTARIRAGLPPVPPGPTLPWNGRKLLVFLGHLEAPHNLLAIDSFIGATLPALLARHPDLRLRLVGRGGEAVAARHAARFGDVIEATGFVADLGALLAPAAAMIAPLAWGSGVKTKLLDGLRHGLPILCTRLAAEGLPLADSAAACIEDDPGRWPAALDRIFDPTANATMRAASAALAHWLGAEAQRDMVAFLQGGDW